MTDRQKLSVTDQAMLNVDRAVRAVGGAGFETQVFVWLSGRADAAGLRSALARLGERYPIVTARLVEQEASSFWQFRGEARCTLQEIELESAEPQAVLDHAAGLYVACNDPTATDPLRCHLLHRPDGRDVFLLQYNHALMDNGATVLLLREIDRLSRIPSPSPSRGREPPEQAAQAPGADAPGSGSGWDRSGLPPGADAPGSGSEAPPQQWPDLVRAYLRRWPAASKRDASRQAAVWPRLVGGGVAMLGRPTAEPAQVRFAVRRLDEGQTRALRDRVIRVCGFPSLSMALVASAFRVVAGLSPQRRAGSHNLIVGIGVDLGLRGEQGPIFQNLTSLLPLRARSEDLADRDGLLRQLTGQFRERLENRFDLGTLRAVGRLNRRPHQLRYLVEMTLRLGFSLWYAYFGSADGIGDRFAGAIIEDVYCTGPSWPPVGLTLLANQFRGRLGLQVTYVPASVSEALANAFLDEVIGDLT
jgi:hypothetical protein